MATRPELTVEAAVSRVMVCDIRFIICYGGYLFIEIIPIFMFCSYCADRSVHKT